jgi:Flp pilus assembly protein TadG
MYSNGYSSEQMLSPKLRYMTPITATSLIGNGRKRVRAAGERGQAAIEFTLVVPILLLVMTGMLAFGVVLHNFVALTYGVNSGAQLLAISRGQTTDPCSTASTAINNAVPGLSSGLSLSFVINGTSYSGTTCTAGAANMVQGATAQVTATYPCTLGVFEMGSHACSLKTQLSEVIQ